MTIPFLDVGAAYRELKPEIDKAVARVMDSGWYIQGPEVEAFEDDFAKFCNVTHAIGVGNGLDALVLSLRALGIGAGDEVIVPSNTYIATWLAVSQVGATIVPVEPEIALHTISAESCMKVMTSKTRAIIPVHLYGQPADLNPLLQLARENGIFIIEDAAQAHGAGYRSEVIGGFGDLTCWSFYPGKNLGALGDGGAVTTRNPDLAKRVRLLSNYGSEKKYMHEVAGTNSRLDPVQAAVLRVKLRHLAGWNERRRTIARRYLEGLQGLDLVLPEVPQWADPVWHLFVVRSKERDALATRLTAKGVQSLIHYPLPPHLQGAYAALSYSEGDFPVAEQLAKEVLSLPMGPHLTEQQASQVIDALRRAT
ncbi:DegT/DnrJ/EryC1/StrS aminotransferase family protein [Leisingera sp. ANG59]|uniref:DegT/DnrJ/EryC1/StrS family aminotransferase n=1 Tax=Leisingera sp. ANG59 TaxID=2675221 RepID=UPI001573CFDD|nr:DegT/DnrJ/EryC1/StrS family aminotransferase [Leisingera sp. ANG59]NSY38669.1 aminotransferase class I/II-fold pyridoxal phosphate-dependent enzyme [Leisingera sp. ANG59]